MRVLFIPTTNSGISYWRMFNYAQAAQRHSIAQVRMLWWTRDLNDTHPWEKDVIENEHMARITSEMNAYAREADVIVMQMVHTPAALNIFYALKEAYPDKPVLAEIDDNILSTPTYNPADPFYAPGEMFRKLAVEQFRSADALIVSTPYLAEVYADLNDHIYVVENAIDEATWRKVRKKKRPGIRIGWAGGASHDEDLRIIEPTVRAILQKHPEARFTFVHGVPNFLKKIQGVEPVLKWSRIDKYPSFLGKQGFDIGVAPLVDNAFNRGKSNLRWLEYSALGIPTVASNVGHFAQTLTPETGILADDTKGFTDALDKLILDRKYRRKMGQAAQARVFTEFEAATKTREYMSHLAEVIERGPVGSVPDPVIPEETPLKPHTEVGEEILH